MRDVRSKDSAAAISLIMRRHVRGVAMKQSVFKQADNADLVVKKHESNFRESSDLFAWEFGHHHKAGARHQKRQTLFLPILY